MTISSRPTIAICGMSVRVSLYIEEVMLYSRLLISVAWPIVAVLPLYEIMTPKYPCTTEALFCDTSLNGIAGKFAAWAFSLAFSSFCGSTIAVFTFALSLSYSRRRSVTSRFTPDNCVGTSEETANSIVTVSSRFCSIFLVAGVSVYALPFEKSSLKDMVDRKKFETKNRTKTISTIDCILKRYSPNAWTTFTCFRALRKLNLITSFNIDNC